MDRFNEFVEDLRQNWDNAYWWADHQLLQTVLACTLIGMIGLGFKYIELRMVERIGAAPNV